MKKDRLVAGGVAGLVGGVAQTLFGQAARALHLTDRTFLDYASILYAFDRPKGFLGYVVAILLLLTQTAALGVVFAYLIKLTSSNYYYIKAVGYSMILWWLLGTSGSIFKLPLFKEVPPGPALETLAGALVFGFVMAIVLKIIERRTNLV